MHKCPTYTSGVGQSHISTRDVQKCLLDLPYVSKFGQRSVRRSDRQTDRQTDLPKGWQSRHGAEGMDADKKFSQHSNSSAYLYKLTQ